ncbi:MAG: SusC/RagA family TonB-linked outer membrane protein [Odoribacter sp.]
MMFFLFCFVCGGYANSLAQYRVNVRLGETTYKQLFEEIRKQTGCIVMYNDNMLNKHDRVRADFPDAALEDVLQKVLSGKGLSYEKDDEFIIIVKAPVAPQQKITLTGKVRDKAGSVLPGVSVFVKGTTVGVATDNNGAFKLELPSLNNLTLVFSFIGMKSKEVKISDSKPLTIVLEEDAQEMDEVVVNGIFERKANTFTGSVRTISKEDLKRVGNSNVMQSLKNLDPSIIFIDNMALGSDPNAVPEMVLRGKSSINIEDTDLKATYGTDPNAPLFVLDGFEVSLQKVMDLDMDRVESLTILKDASAKAIYGAKAANGVIVIELKKSTNGELRVTYNGSIDIEAPDLTSYDLCDAAEKLEIEKIFGMYDSPEASYENQRMSQKVYNQKLAAVISGINTDWLSKPVQMGVGTKHGVSVELGDKELRAIIDLSYNNIKGVMKGSDRTNISGGLSLSYRRSKFLFRDQFTITSNVANDSKYGSFSEYAALNPYYTPYDQYGMITENIVPHLETGNSVTVNEWMKKIEFQANPLYNAQLNTLLRNKYIDFTNNFEIQWFVFEGLKATARLGLTEKRSREDQFYPANHLKFRNFINEDQFRKGSYKLANGEESNISGKIDIQYNKEFLPGHTVYVNGGFDVDQKKYSNTIHNAEGFPSDKMNDIIFARQYTKDTKPSGTEQTIRSIGYYLSANYSFDSRINLDGTFRQNASSQYGANSRWGEFWSVGASWNLHNETWLKGSDIGQLRLRASTGSTGSQSTAAYNAIASFEYFLDKTYNNALGAQLKNMRNESLKWQEKMEYNFGLDFNYKNRYSLTLEYYISTTNNAVNPLDLVPSTGFSTVQENVGKVENRGIDFRASATAWQRTSDRSFLRFSLMLSHNKNKLKDISNAMRSYNERQNELASKDNKPVNKYYDGVSMDAIWAMPSLGIDPATGKEIYLATDKNGNTYRTFTYDGSQQVVCGDKMEKINGNAGVDFMYKGFGVSAVLIFKYGGKMYNSTLVSKVENADMEGNVDRRIFTGRWRKEGDISPYKALGKVYLGDKDEFASPKTYETSRFVQKRNELTISSLQASYDFFRHAFVKKAGFERIVLRFNVNDLATFSTIKIERGTDYPFARKFNASLTFTL